MHFRRGFVALTLSTLLAWPAFGAELVMVEQPGCHYCEQWNSQVSAIYPKTKVGQHAPLRREQLRAPPSDVSYARPVNFTPTFILAENGKEIGRLEGYPGEDFFWFFVEKMVAENTSFVKETQ